MPLAVDVGLKPRVDARLKQPCADLVDLPDRDIGPEEGARLWAIDRQNFGHCRKKDAALVESVEALER